MSSRRHYNILGTETCLVEGPRIVITAGFSFIFPQKNLSLLLPPPPPPFLPKSEQKNPTVHTLCHPRKPYRRVKLTNLFISVVAPTGTPTSASPAPQPAQMPGPPAGVAPQFLRHRTGLCRADLHPNDPIAQFHTWFTEASEAAAGVAHPETCTLATAALPSGRVSARMVYMKELDERGFVIYSNFGTSGKSRDLFGLPRGGGGGGADADMLQPQANPWVSLVFLVGILERQVRVEGRAERIPCGRKPGLLRHARAWEPYRGLGQPAK